jgi:peptidoglycan/xylan/chitin deacetylase (PgdA/CDA1 family)
MPLMKLIVKACVFRSMGSSFLTRLKLFAIQSKRALTVLNLHRVSGHNGSAYEALSPELFDGLLGWLKVRFHVLTFSELADFEPCDRPPMVLSFDDGYLDFVEVAAPILAKHGLKANQNVIPGCIESGKPPFNVWLQDFIGQAPESLLREVALPGVSSRESFKDRGEVGRKASSTLKVLSIDLQVQTMENLRRHFERLDNFRTTPMMTLDQIINVSAKHEIGVHSWQHATMSAESDEYLAHDAQRCRNWLREHITGVDAVYAFPNGMMREGQAAIVRDVGFDHVLCVGEGFSEKENWQHSRFTFHAKSEAECRFRSTGGLAWPRK